MLRFLCVFVIILLVNSAISLPVEDSTDSTDTTNSDVSEDTSESTNNTDETNGTQNLFVIKSVVYEIGILTDGDDNITSNDTHEQVDVSFFDPSHNGSLIDLSNIPIPIQTNISGVTVTGILPTDLGSISVNSDGTASFNNSGLPIFPSRQVRITHNISLADEDSNSSILSELPKLLGLDETAKSNETSDENKENKIDGKETDVKESPKVKESS